jgi:hypothetical protein
VEQAGLEPAKIPYLSPAGYLEDSNLIPNASGALPFTTAPYFFLLIKDNDNISIYQLIL